MLKDLIEEVSLKKEDHFLKIRQVCCYVAYIESGLTMHYHLYDGIESRWSPTNNSSRHQQ